MRLMPEEGPWNVWWGGGEAVVRCEMEDVDAEDVEVDDMEDEMGVVGVVDDTITVGAAEAMIVIMLKN